MSIEKRKPTKTYDELSKEVRSITREYIQQYIPLLCRTLRDEYIENNKDDDKTTYMKYTEKDGIMYETSAKYTQEEIQKNAKEDIEFRNDSIKMRIMYDMRGVLFRDRIYDKHGVKLLPKKAKKVFSMEHAKEGIKSGFIPTERWNRITESWEIVGNFEIKKERLGMGIFKGYTWSKPKEQSEMSKFVEAVIDQEISSWKN